jgi:hypothetical protein
VSASDRLDSAPPKDRASGPSIAAAAAAITDISERVLALVREEIELAKAEVGEKVSSILSGAAVAAAAGAFVIGALMLILIGLSLLVSYLLPVETSEFFWGFFVVALVLLLLAALAAYIAARAVRAGAPPTPDMAVEEARRIRESVGTGSGLEAHPDGGSLPTGDQVQAAEATTQAESQANANRGDGSDATTLAN